MPPIYQPEVAARTVVYAADHPQRREYWVGETTAATLLANAVAPGLLDRYLGRTGFDAQQTGEPRDPDQPANLWEPAGRRGGRDFGAHGGFDDRSHAPLAPGVGVPAPRRGALDAGPGRRGRAGGSRPPWEVGDDVRISETSDLWWKTAVVYCLDVQTFMDWNDDGMGDFHGLAERIDYLSELGVTCLWLMPFYPTTDRDDGYDITDYYGVDPRLGTLGDFVEVVRTARDRGMRVIIDLVLNHTSDRHPWFRAARPSTTSPYRDFYVWRADEPPDTSAQVVFPDKENSIWEYDEKTRGVVPAPLLPDPARPQHHRQPRCATRSSRPWASGSSSASRASGSTPCRS